MLAIVASLMTVLTAFAWHAGVKVVADCAKWHVQEDNVYSPETATIVITPADHGDWSNGDTVNGNLHVSWSDSDEEYDYPWTAVKPEDCTPPASPQLNAYVSCVRGEFGIRDTLRLFVAYDTDGPALTLTRRVRVDGVSRINHVMQVQGEDQLTTYRRVGRGDHIVRGRVVLGAIVVNLHRTIHCAPRLVGHPRAEILQPCADPKGGALYDNRSPNFSVTFVLETSASRNGPWHEVNSRTVAGGDYFVTKAYYFQPESWVRVRRGGGHVLDIEQVAPGGEYGWKSKECQILRSRKLPS
jgi:hypothetical protein